MKNCDHYQKSFSDCLDDTVDDSTHTKIKTHLNECPDCRQKFQRMSAIKASLSSLPRVKTSESFDIVLHARLRQERRAQHSKRWSLPFFELGWKTPVYATAAILLMFIGAQFQRFATMESTYTPQGDMVAIEHALQGDMNFIDPGYMIVSGMDSVRNTLKVVNYTDLDRAATMAEFDRRRRSNSTYDANSRLQNRQLPNLKEAPQNNSRFTQDFVRRTSTPISPVEIVF